MKNWIKTGLASLVLIGGGMATAYAEDLDTILSGGKLRAGLCLTSEPAGFRDGEGNLKGYDVDAANLMAEALGVQLEVVEVTGPTRIPMLLSNKIDVIVCNITATTERARSINFSFPYLRTGIKLLIQKGSGIKGFEDIGAGKKFIVGRGTTGETMAKLRSPDAELVYIENTPDAITLMRQGKADVFIEDSLGIDYIAKLIPISSRRCRTPIRPTRSPSACARAIRNSCASSICSPRSMSRPANMLKTTPSGGARHRRR